MRGLRELARDARRVDKRINAATRRGNRLLANQVRDKVRDAMSAFGSTPAKAAKGVSATVSDIRAGIKIGGSRYPFAVGAEFGALRWRQFSNGHPGPWRGNDENAGYFLWPHVRQIEASGEIANQHLDQLGIAFADAFPEGTPIRGDN